MKHLMARERSPRNRPAYCAGAMSAVVGQVAGQLQRGDEGSSS